MYTAIEFSPKTGSWLSSFCDTEFWLALWLALWIIQVVIFFSQYIWGFFRIFIVRSGKSGKNGLYECATESSDVEYEGLPIAEKKLIVKINYKNIN